MANTPVVSIIPAGAGTLTNPPIQIPTGDNTAVTLLNLSSSLSVVLCGDDNFNPSTTWSLAPGQSLPITTTSNIYIQNSNITQVQILVIPGVVPASYTPISIGASVVEVQLAIGGTHTNILPKPLTGYAYKIHSIVVDQPNSAGVSNILVLDQDLVPFWPFFETLLPAGIYGNTFMMNGLLVTGPLGTTGPIGGYSVLSNEPILITMRYDLVIQ